MFSLRSLPLLVAALGFTSLPLAAHGPGHRHGAHSHGEEATTRPWGVQVQTGWESRHVHYGVDESGLQGAYTNELTLRYDRWIFQFWQGKGLGNDFEKYEFSLAGHFHAGPLFIHPGYRFRYQPGLVERGEAGHAHAEEGHHAHDHDHDHEAEATHGHVHKRHGHELFLNIGTEAIPYVTPNIVIVCDLHNTPGTYAELRLDGELPLIADRVSLRPYALLGLNFGFNTREQYGWNHFQTGAEITVVVCDHVSFVGGAHYSVALDAVRSTGQENAAWVNAGLAFSF